MDQDHGHGRETCGRSFEAIKSSLSQRLLDIQKPSDFIITLIYCVPILAPVRVCIESSIFLRLVHAGSTLQAHELLTDDDDTADGVRIEFMVRMLRAVSSIGLVDEVAPRTYRANELTTLMADPGFAAGFQLLFDNAVGPQSTMSEMINLAKSTAPVSATDGPWQRARGAIGQTTFEHWEKRDPVQLVRLSQLMQRMQPETVHWTDWVPSDALFTTDETSEVPFLVDIGGGRGHDISALAAKYPNRDMKLVLQDLPSVIQEGVQERQQIGAILDPRITLSEHNFFEAQPIQGAGIYYMHKIMHDWPDDDCVSILTHLREVMGPASRILIHDVVLPDQGASLLQAAFDVAMLALHSGKERDLTAWRELVASVGGLEIMGFRSPPPGSMESIVELRLARND